MDNHKSSLPLEFYWALPKVDLHRHLEGSWRLRTMQEVGRAHGINQMSTDSLRSKVQVLETQPLTFQNFLSKFEILRQYYRTPEVIIRVTREAICDAAADNVRYLELRFTPVALSRAGNFSLVDVIGWVIEGAYQAETETGIMVRLIASVNRHEPTDVAEEVVQLAADRMEAGIVGIDLAGNEAHFPASPFAGIFKEARQAGLHATVHAGEWGTAGNIASAITRLGADRIGHGVRVTEDPSVAALAREHGTTFEVCLTSNYQTGAVSNLTTHPLPQMMAEKLKVTINTDDPGISRTTLSNEYRLACEQLDFPLEALRDSVLSAAWAAFLPEVDRWKLVASLEAEFPLIPGGELAIPQNGTIHSPSNGYYHR